MKKVVVLILLTSLLWASSCSKEDYEPLSLSETEQEPLPEVIEGNYQEWNLAPNGESLRLCCGLKDSAHSAKQAIFCWYERRDSSWIKLIRAHNNYFDTDKFNEIGIKQFKCVSSLIYNSDSIHNQEFLFYVAFTGLPAIYISTDDARPVLSKTEKIPGVISVIMPNGGG